MDSRTIKERRGKTRKGSSQKNWLNDFLMILSTARHQPTSLLLCPAQIFNYSVTTWCIKMHFFRFVARCIIQCSKNETKKWNKNSSAWSWQAGRVEIYRNYEPCSSFFASFNECPSIAALLIFPLKTCHQIVSALESIHHENISIPAFRSSTFPYGIVGIKPRYQNSFIGKNRNRTHTRKGNE